MNRTQAQEPIDAVYTWVDGREPEFQEQLRRYRRPEDAGARSAATRFHDNDELRFSLRSLERHAPWIRNVYLVTNGQVPAWIDRSHPRLSLIRHEDLFPDRSVLPVFNSVAIEWQLFRIPGLSKQFLYFNDDCFLGRPVAPVDFMTPRGGHRVFVEDYNITDKPAIHTGNLLNARFGTRSPRKKIAHTPRFVDRTILEEVDRIWAEEIRRTSEHRFRNPEDVEPWTLYCHYLLECPEQFGLHAAAVVKGSLEDYMLLQLSCPIISHAWKGLALIARRRPKFFCLNDDTDNGSRAAAALLRLSARAFLKLLYWRPSSFEKGGID